MNFNQTNNNAGDVVNVIPGAKYIVIYESGSCMDQDHNTGSEAFGTLEEARKFAVEYDKSHSGDADISVIYGAEVTDPNWFQY